MICCIYNFEKEGNALKATKIFAFLFALLLTVSAFLPLGASAITVDTENMKLQPGNLQFLTSEYNMAWLNKLVIRDDATAIKEARIVPRADYPYSHTYEGYIKEVNDYAELKELDEKSAVSGYNTALEAFFYGVTAMGMTDNYDEMFNFLCNYGIRMPEEMTTSDKMLVSCVYAAVKYNAIYALYGESVSIPKGTTLEGAAVNIIAAVTGAYVPSGIDSLSGFVIISMRNYIDSINEIPLSDNPENDELFHWVKATTASNGGYVIPMIDYTQTTQEQRDYVDYAYYATILNKAYDVELNPFLLQEEYIKKDETAVAVLILKTMLNAKNVAFDENASPETLFNTACENGCFMLEEEFYSDIYNYDIFVKESCGKLWFTPFGLADQLEGDNQFLSIRLGDKVLTSESTNFAPLDTGKKAESVSLEVTYNDGNGVPDKVTYNFNIIKVKEDPSVTQPSDVVGQIQNAIDDLVPDDNEKASDIVEGVMESVSAAIPSAPKAEEATEKTTTALTTYGSVSEKEDETGKTAFGGIDFEYLEELFAETYANNEITYSALDLGDDETGKDEGEGFIAKTTEAIKENPEIVVAPTSVIAVGGLAGYLLGKKKHYGTDDEIEEE